MPNMTTAEVASAAGLRRRQVVRLVEAKKLKYAQKLPGRTGSYLFRPSEVRRVFPDAVIPEPAEQIPA